MVNQSLADLTGQTPLQLRHYLKENWNNFIQLSEEKGTTAEINSIIYNNLFRDIKHISDTKPSMLEVEDTPQLKLEQINSMYDQIIKLIPEHKKVTIYALCWASLCNHQKKTFVDYIEKEKT